MGGGKYETNTFNCETKQSWRDSWVFENHCSGNSGSKPSLGLCQVVQFLPSTAPKHTWKIDKRS